MNYTFAAVIISFITFATFTSLNELALANEPNECCSFQYCAKHQIDSLAWWAHLIIGIMATSYVLFVVGSSVARRRTATPMINILR
jgi:hypothetical protein